jgi:transcriptional regulator with PAS, ATPase and Fis domain
MVWDAVSYHKSGKLSLKVFKKHIVPTLPSENAAKEMPPEKENELILFSEKLPTLKQMESLLIAEALRRSEGNQAIAAMSLGISRQALNSRLKRNRS